MPGLKERAKTLVELLDGAGFLFAPRPLTMDAKAEEILARGGRLHLAASAAAPDGAHGVDARQATEAAVRAYAEERRRQARNRRSAAARGRDRSLDLARHLRCARGARARGEPRADRGSGGDRELTGRPPRLGARGTALGWRSSLRGAKRRTPEAAERSTFPGSRRLTFAMTIPFRPSCIVWVRNRRLTFGCEPADRPLGRGSER